MDTFTMSLISEYLNIQSSVMLSFSKMSCTQKINAIKKEGKCGKCTCQRVNIEILNQYIRVWFQNQ